MSDPNGRDPGPERGSTPPPDASALEAAIAEARARAMEEAREAFAAERRTLERERDRARRIARERERALAITRADADRVRNHPAVRFGRGISRRLRGPIRAARQGLVTIRRVRDVARRAARRFLPGGRAMGAAELAAFLERVAATLPPPPAAGPERVSVVIDGRDVTRLRRCLAALDRVAWPDLEILVAASNADALVRAATGGDDRRPEGRGRIRPVTGISSSEARAEATLIAGGAWILYLHEDVEGLDPHWLGRLVAASRDRDAGAVGARLLHPVDAAPAGGRSRALRIAHDGLHLVTREGMPVPAVLGDGGDPLAGLADGPRVVPAASEACLLVRRDVAQRATLGDGAAAEPLELVLAVRSAGLDVVLEPGALLWHHRAVAEARADAPMPRAAGPAGPARVGTGDPAPPSLHETWGPALFRTVLLDRLAGGTAWSEAPLHVGITLTSDDPDKGFGDWYTAHELGTALEALGWKVTYLAREGDAWYRPDPTVDVIVSLLPQLDVHRLGRGAITVAWIRNWTEEWVRLPWFDSYDLVLVSSERSRAIVEERSAHVAHVFAIATNPDRFASLPRSADQAGGAEAVFTGSSWGSPRGVELALPDLVEAGIRVHVHGRGWDGHPGLRDAVRGFVTYDELPAIYARTPIVIDDAAISTKPYGSMNSRVFDALASGALVVTDNTLGVAELFDDEFPTWHDGPSLVAVVRALLDDPARREALAARYRSIVLERHTYAHRARELRDLLGAWAAQRRVALHIGPQTWEMGAHWGDVPFGRDIQRQLERRGHPTSLLVHDERFAAAALRADIAIHVFGVRAPRPLAGQVNALWVISHPDRVNPDLCATYDAVFVASDRFLEHLRRRTDVPLHPLHQATEPARFFPDPAGPHHELLFVGNSRGVHRPIIDDLRGTNRDLAVYGGMWTPELLDPRFLRGTWIANDELRIYYSSADIVLNDHWGDMRDEGFISNRVYDALACGALVISDFVPGIDEEFDGAVVTYRDAADLQVQVDRYLDDPEARNERAARGRAAVLERHTFAHRADTLLGVLEPLLGFHAATVTERRDPGATERAR